MKAVAAWEDALGGGLIFRGRKGSHGTNSRRVSKSGCLCRGGGEGPAGGAGFASQDWERPRAAQQGRRFPGVQLSADAPRHPFTKG